MRWEGKQVWMELKELRETRQEKSQEMAALSGLEHTAMLWRASVSAAPSLSLSTRVPLGLLSPAQRRKKMWSWGHRAGAGQGRWGEGSTSGAEFCRQRVKQLEHEDKPTSMAAGSPQGRGPGGPWQSSRGCARGLSTKSGPMLLEGSEPTTWFLKATSIQTTVSEDSTVLPSQELLLIRNAVGAAKGNDTSTCDTGASCHHGPQPLGAFSLGALEWEKPPAAAFCQQKALGEAAMCPGGGSGQPTPLHCPLQQPPTTPVPWLEAEQGKVRVAGALP